MHNNFSETTQPGSNVVNVIPTHEFGKPYTYFTPEEKKTLWLERNNPEKIGTLIAMIYTNIGACLIYKNTIDQDALTHFIDALKFESIILLQNTIIQQEKYYTTQEIVTDEEVKYILDVLEQHINHLEERLQNFSNKQTPTAAVISTFSAKNEQETT